MTLPFKTVYPNKIELSQLRFNEIEWHMTYNRMTLATSDILACWIKKYEGRRPQSHVVVCDIVILIEDVRLSIFVVLIIDLLSNILQIIHADMQNPLYIVIINPMSKAIVALFSLVFLAAATVIPRIGPIVSHPAATYKVQIDDPPLKRWAPILRDFNESLHRFVEFLDLLPVPHGFYDGVEWFAKNEFKYQDFVAEVDAISTLSGIPFQKLIFLNFLYEFTTVFKACTGILVRNSEGKIIHGRNWDFEMYQLLAKMVSSVEYYRGDQKIFTEDTVAGSAFTITGIKHGAFAISVNARHTKNHTQTLISVLKDNAIPALWLVRKVLLEETTYAGATERLRNTEISCTIYYIVSGVKGNEGMVIERDTNQTHAYYELNDYMWFLIQTNYDRDQPDPIHDPRRIPTEHKLADRGNHNFTEQTLLEEFMFKWPNFNIATIYTDILVPSIGYKNTTVWYGDITYLSRE